MRFAFFQTAAQSGAEAIKLEALFWVERTLRLAPHLQRLAEPVSEVVVAEAAVVDPRPSHRAHEQLGQRVNESRKFSTVMPTPYVE